MFDMDEKAERRTREATRKAMAANICDAAEIEAELWLWGTFEMIPSLPWGVWQEEYGRIKW